MEGGDGTGRVEFSTVIVKADGEGGEAVEMGCQGGAPIVLSAKAGGIMARSEGVLPMLLLTARSQIEHYEIIVRTGDFADAATDAPVTFTLIGSGSRSVSMTVDPKQSAIGKAPFRRDGTDILKVCVVMKYTSTPE
jgi:hypothetical protein